MECQVTPDSSTQAVRHAEKRRTSTCSFADRVATLSVQHYRSKIPLWYREQQKQTCVATILAHQRSPNTISTGSKNSHDEPGIDHDSLYILAMGVGTKFLPEAVLRQEGVIYGRRVRDCHAEVLARRAFRRYLSLEIRALHEQPSDAGPHAKRPRMATSILEPSPSGKYVLRAGVTLHFYSSSAPCGNAVLKKFATMKKFTIRDDLGPDDWPHEEHESMPGHSLPAGEFALLLKKDSSAAKSGAPCLMNDPRLSLPQKQMAWPANTSGDWCPPGTTPVWATNSGSLHTCSDKICRWNILGLQGSLLSSLIECPLYLSSLTIGRKFSEVICRRALCCRASRKNDHGDSCFESQGYCLHHPALMGTSVYLDGETVIDMSERRQAGQDVRFHSPMAWAWWQSTGPGNLDCVNGCTGWSHTLAPNDNDTTLASQVFIPSLVSTFALVELYRSIEPKRCGQANMSATAAIQTLSPSTLAELRRLKRSVAGVYETAKDRLLSEHRLFRHWRRREAGIDEESNHGLLKVN